MIFKPRYVFSILFLCVCAGLMSCESTKSPLQVSEHFWLGMQTENVALVRKYSLSNSIDEEEDLSKFKNITAATFGRIIIDGAVAEVETIVSMVTDEKTTEITLNTYLESHNKVWKVNYRKTVLQLMIKQNMSEVLGDIEVISEEITEQIEQSVEKIKEKVVPEIKSKAEEIQEKVIPEIKSKVEQVEKELLEKLPEFQNIFDQFLRELEKSLEELIPAEEDKEVKTQET